MNHGVKSEFVMLAKTKLTAFCLMLCLQLSARPPKEYGSISGILTQLLPEVEIFAFTLISEHEIKEIFSTKISFLQ